jgi:sugar lactone lactonase YvrE
LLAIAACAPPLPRQRTDLVDLEPVVPREIRLLHVYGGGKLEPYGPLARPSAAVSLADGRFVLADAGSGRLHIFDAEGLYEAAAEDPPEGNLLPLDLAAHGFHLLVLDGASRRLMRYDESGAFRDVLLDIAALDASARIDPVAFAVDRDGRLAIADAAGDRILITGSFLELDQSIGEFGGLPGQLDDPRGVCFGLHGHLYVADRRNRRVQAFDRAGFLVASTSSLGGANDLFAAPTGIAADRYGNLFVADPVQSRVVMLSPSLQELAILGADEFAPDDLRQPVRCAVSDDGLLFVVDAGQNALVVFELDYR